MNFFRLIAVASLLVSLNAPVNAYTLPLPEDLNSTNSPNVIGAIESVTNTAATYYMMGSSTMIWDHDVSYFPNQIILQRSKNTGPFHRLEFNVARYEQVCVRWEQVCVRFDPQGRCLQYEYRCTMVDDRVYQVPKVIELDFARLPKLINEEEEFYQINIDRMRPAGNGEDWVTSNFYVTTTLSPQKVTRWSDFRYVIEPKE